MATKPVEASDSVDQGIPLDLGPLLSPYRRHKNLSIRVEKLPQLSRLSQGRNNGDCTFSIKPDELQGLLYLPPPGSDGSPATLAVRIINLDDDYATTLALIDLPVPSGPISEDAKKHTLRVVESTEEVEDEAEDEPAEPAALTAIHVKRNADVGSTVLPAGTDVRQELETEISQLREKLETSATDTDQTQKQVLEAAEAALARDFVEQITATKEQLEKRFSDRLSEALREVEEKAEARIAVAEKAAEEKARETAETDQASNLSGQIAAAKKEQEQAFKDRLGEALAKAEEAAEARIANSEKKTEKSTKSALADAQKSFDEDLKQLRQQQETASLEINEASKKQIEAAETEHAREIAKLQASHVRALETQASAMAEQLETEFTDRLNQIVSDAEDKVIAQVAAAELRATKAAEAETASALAEAKEAFDGELTELRQKLDAAAADIETGHKQALEAADKTHAEEIAALQKTHASDIEAQTAASQEQISTTEARLAQESADSLAEALRLAEEEASTALTEARQNWDGEAQSSLLAARDTWLSEEAARLGGAKKQFEDELAQLRQQLDADSTEVEEIGRKALDAANTVHTQEIAKLTQSHERALEKQIAASKKQLEHEIAERVAEALSQGEAAAKQRTETSLAEARVTWEADADAALSAARITWRAEEAERLEAAKNDYEGQLAKIRKEQPDIGTDIDLDEIRKQAAEDADANHATEIAALKAAHAEALKARATADEIPVTEDVAERIAGAVREAEEKTEARIAKARLVWDADAEAKLAKARETWKTEETDRLEAAKNTWQGHSRKGPTARERAYREQRSWVPRRSRVLALAIVGLVGFPLVHPDVRPLVFERSTQAYTEIRGRIDALLAPKPVAVKPAVSNPAAAPIPLPSLADLPINISGRVIIAVGSANVRAGPSSGAAVIKSLPRGSAASVLGSEKGWQLIRFGEGTDDVGWVYGDLLSAPPIGETTP